MDYRDEGGAAAAGAAASGHPGAPTRLNLPASFFRTVVETANEGIWMIGLDGLTTFANDRMERMLKVSPGELQGRHPSEFLVPEDLPMAAEVIQRTLAGESQEFEPRFIRGDDSVLATLGGTAAIRDDQGAIVGAVATFSDVSAYKEAERALRVSEQEANESAALLHHLLESAGDAIWMRDVDGVFRVANAAASAVMAGPDGNVIGRTIFEIWGLKVGAHLSEETQRILESGKPLTVEEEMFDVGKDGTTTFLSNKVPVYSPDGEPLGILGVSRDITERKRVEDDLRESQAQLARQLAETKALYEAAPIGLGFFSRDYRYLKINDELAAINGVPAEEHIGRTIREVLSDGAPPVEPIIDQVFATGEAVQIETSGETPQQPGVIRHWLAGFYPVKDAEGEVQAVGAWVIEITDRKAAEQREMLLAREVDHRAKNLLAVVQSVVQLTRADTAEDLKEAVVGRIQALARAHALLADARWEGVELTQLVAEELAPYSGGQAQFEGVPVFLRPAAAQSLAMVLHELATNAAKYGALADAGGSLRVSWQYDSASARLRLDWIESGSALVEAPTNSGFGSKIITSVERQLRGKLTQRWAPDGLQCTLDFPIDPEAVGKAAG